MTLEELWQLFPIFLTEHNPYWRDWYNEETAELKCILPSDSMFHHIGSTAVLGIMAKPIIDILITVSSADELKQAADILQDHGYIVMSVAKNRISLNKGYTESGFAEKVFHLHLRLRLWKKYEHDRDAYTAAKTEFIAKYTDLAKHSKY